MVVSPIPIRALPVAVMLERFLNSEIAASFEGLFYSGHNS
jgi:hypothetical protein